MTAPPLRLDRLQQGLFETLGSALSSRYTTDPPTLSWAYGEQSFESTSGGGLISLSVLAGPTPLLRTQARGRTIHDTTSIEVVVDAAVAGVYAVTLNCYVYRYTADGTETVEEIRDALLASITAGEATYGSVAPSAVGTDTILLTSTQTAGLWQLSISGPLMIQNRVDSGQIATLTEGQTEVVVNIQCFSKGRQPRDGAWDLTQTIMSALQTPSIAQELNLWGVGLGNKGNPIDISATTGGHWSTRTTFDVTMFMRSVWAVEVAKAQSISLTLNTLQPTTQTTVEIPL